MRGHNIGMFSGFFDHDFSCQVNVGIIANFYVYWPDHCRIFYSPVNYRFIANSRVRDYKPPVVPGYDYSMPEVKVCNLPILIHNIQPVSNPERLKNGKGKPCYYIAQCVLGCKTDDNTGNSCPCKE